MAPLPGPIESVIAELSRLPGIGRKTAQRLAFFLLKAQDEQATSLANALLELKAKIRFCSRCFNLSDGDLCGICADPKRDDSLLCIVEEPTNLVALERTGVFRGVYHVLGGALSPLRDIGPDDLNVRPLVERIGAGQFREVVLATSPNVEGESTAVYLARLLQPLGVELTRLAQGVPAGGDLEFTDDLTLQKALEGRRQY